MNRDQLFRIFCESCKEKEIPEFENPEEWANIDTTATLPHFGMDSLDILEVIMEMERRLDLQVHIEDFGLETTIDQVLILTLRTIEKNEKIDEE